MKKYLAFILLILLSCQKDELQIIEPYPQYEMIFEESQVLIIDGQEISFEVITNKQHQLIISTQDGSVVTKESFQPQVGINTRKIYTNTLPKETLILKLQTESEILQSVSIIVE